METAQKERLTEAVDPTQGRSNVLDRCVHRLEYYKLEEEKKKAAQAEEDETRQAFQRIDWHDFVIVETIDFGDDDEELALPEPKTAGDGDTLTHNGKMMAPTS